MKSLSVFLMICGLGLSGCGSTQAAMPDQNQLTPAFTKPAKVAYSLLDQAAMGHPVLKTDVSRALAEAEAQKTSIRDVQVFSALDLARMHLQESRYDVKELDKVFACKAAAEDALIGYSADQFPKDYAACTAQAAVKPLTKKKH